MKGSSQWLHPAQKIIEWEKERWYAKILEMPVQLQSDITVICVDLMMRFGIYWAGFARSVLSSSFAVCSSTTNLLCKTKKKSNLPTHFCSSKWDTTGRWCPVRAHVCFMLSYDGAEPEVSGHSWKRCPRCCGVQQPPLPTLSAGATGSEDWLCLGCEAVCSPGLPFPPWLCVHIFSKYKQQGFPAS